MTLRDQLGKPILFHYIGWHGKDGPGTSLTGYDSRDPNVIASQLDAMAALGGNDFGVIALTYGPTVSPFIHQAVMAMGNQCAARGVPFALCFDPWTVKDSHGNPLPQPARNSTMIAALKHPDIQFLLNMRCYLPGKPVLDFATGCDKPTIVAAVPGIEYWLDGTDFDWPRIPGPTVNKTNLPCKFIEFNDGTGPDRNKSAWDPTKPVRIIPALAGSTFWGLNTALGQYIQFATWNDVSEGTSIEQFASMLSGRIA